MSLSPNTVAATLSAVLLCSPVWAATEIQQSAAARGAGAPSSPQAPRTQTSKILLDTAHARMEAGQAGQYMLFDFANNKMTMVNTQQKQAIDMSTTPKMPDNMPNAPAQPEPVAVKAELVKVGAGPEIAGYATEHYQVKADGKLCSNEFISADAMKVEYVQDFMQAMQKMAEERRKSMGNMPFFKPDPCAKAAEETASEMLKNGMLMRSQDASGQLRNEVVSIKTGVSTNADDFAVPQGFEVLTPQQMMQRAMQRMSQNQGGQNMPQVSPEMRENMQQDMKKRMEEAQQQQQQQQQKQ